MSSIIIYSKKLDALKNIKPNKYLFSEDKGNKSYKQFTILTRNDMYNEISSRKISHFYENIEENDMVKLHININMKVDKIKNKHLLILNKKIQHSIKYYNDILAQEFDINKPQIIILDSSTDLKLSAHIIYVNIHFTNIRELNKFICLVDRTERELCCIDYGIYWVGCFRMLKNSTFGKNNPLKFKSSINYMFINDKTLFMDTLVTNIHPKSHLIKIKNFINNKLLLLKNIYSDNNETVFIEAVKCMKLIDPKYADTYTDWIKIGLCLYNIENSNRCFQEFHNFSKKSKKYIDEIECAYKWSSFHSKKEFIRKLTIGYLKFLAKKSNPVEYQNIIFLTNIPSNDIFDTIKFERDYIMDMDFPIITQKNITCINVINWINNNSLKTLALKSAYNTGKTTLLSSIFEEYGDKFKKILVISYRISLSNEFSNLFDKYGFELYSDGFYNVPRLICQIESLHHINYDPIITNQSSPIYDLVIIDEIASVLNHFMSQTISNPESTFNSLYSIIKASNKVLALDGDFDKRSYDFISHFGKCIVLENTIKKNIKNFNFINNIETFNTNLNDDLKNDKNILLICMSSIMAKKYFTTFAKYEPALYCADVDDDIKIELADVETYWLKKLVIITPCVESGISFNKKHFYKQYVILSDKSTSPRGLLQMLNRVRQFECNDIDIFTNTLPQYSINSFFNYNEVKEYITYVNNSISQIITEPYLQLFNIINIHNHVEKVNKGRKYFIPYFIQLCNNKGYTCNMYINEKHNSYVKSVKTIKTATIDYKEIMIDLPIITIEKATEIEYNIKNLCATQYDKQCFEKYCYKIHWKNAILNDDFFNKWYGKTYILYNLQKLLGKPIIYPENTIICFKHIESDLKVSKIKSIITSFGFDLLKMDIKIQDSMMTHAITFIIANNDIFTDNNALLFCDDKHYISNMLQDYTKNKKDSTFIRFVNTYLLFQYGLKIDYTRKNTRIKVPLPSNINFKKFIKVKTFNLTYIHNINIYLT